MTNNIKKLREQNNISRRQLAELSGIAYTKIGDYENKSDLWIKCHKEGKVFVAMGSSDSLGKLITVFLDWADSNTDTSHWDSMVCNMMEQCQSCNDIEQLRDLYRKIDEDIPTEHPRKRELIEKFYEKWNIVVSKEDLL